MLWRLHADLKPENILIKSKEDDTHIKVADFGVAKTLGYEGLKTFCGSPQYFGAWRRRIVVVARAVAADTVHAQRLRCFAVRTPCTARAVTARAQTCGRLE